MYKLDQNAPQSLAEHKSLFFVGLRFTEQPKVTGHKPDMRNTGGLAIAIYNACTFLNSVLHPSYAQTPLGF